MKLCLYLLLFLLPLQIFGQGNSKCLVIATEMWDTTKRDTIRCIVKNIYGKLLVETDYGRIDARNGQVVYDTNYYRNKRFYLYERDTLLSQIVDCIAENKQRLYADCWDNGYHVQYDIPAVNTKDTIITMFNYDNKTRLLTKENRYGRQSYYYKNSNRIIRDTIIGNEFENIELKVDTSFAFYNYFDKGYYVLRSTHDSSTHSCDSFIYNNKGQLITHISFAQIRFLNSDAESAVPKYLLQTRQYKESFFYSKDGKLTKSLFYDDLGKPFQKDEYIYIH